MIVAQPGEGGRQKEGQIFVTFEDANTNHQRGNQNSWALIASFPGAMTRAIKKGEKDKNPKARAGTSYSKVTEKIGGVERNSERLRNKGRMGKRESAR